VLSKLRREKSYMASWSRAQGAGGALTLVENHCPICAAAQTCQGLCRDELELFQALLPDAGSSTYRPARAAVPIGSSPGRLPPA
jgi:predicted ArsR family transcriptional regulator